MSIPALAAIYYYPARPGSKILNYGILPLKDYLKDLRIMELFVLIVV